ncbi:hypothetical protein EVAR_43627_1 [Eumeta japonica]|uniref:Uncharacterized protein n=1 Tax=Eumeta variegata TaxID=151549 RepID=A0A4C1XHC4_EUMVA|nr:hypothetical protein EVAR_43627_1 [Eumeta japonica]
MSGITVMFDGDVRQILPLIVRSSRASYGDDAVSYVQLKRDGKLCIVKCKICPEHKVHSKVYRCTLVVDEEDESILSVQCEDCVASQGGCKHAIAFLIKRFIKGSPLLQPSSLVLLKFLEEGKKRKIEDCELLKYQPTYSISAPLITKVEEETIEQTNSCLWHELRYGRITASRAFEVSRCKKNDGTLISLILGAKIPDT